MKRSRGNTAVARGDGEVKSGEVNEGGEPGEAAAPAPSESDGRAAYSQCKTRWATLGGADLGAPRANLGLASLRVIQVGNALATPAITAAYKALEAVPLPH